MFKPKSFFSIGSFSLRHLCLGLGHTARPRAIPLYFALSASHSHIHTKVLRTREINLIYKTNFNKLLILF